MEKEKDKAQESSGQLHDILLVLDKERMKIKAVKDIDENGKMKTVSPINKNENQFVRIDKHGDFISNFVSNFLSQLKDPTQFIFFKIPAKQAIEKALRFQEQINNPTSLGKKTMEEHEIKFDRNLNNEIKKQNQMEKSQTPTESNEYRFQTEQIDWSTMNNLGLSKERLEKLNLLEPLLKGYKTNELVPISLNMGGAIVRTDARLSLQQAEDGKIVAAIHGIRKEPNLNFEFFGHQFTDQDKKNLLETGNMGRVVNLINSKTGENIPSIISIDKLTNELIALKSEFIKIPDEIKGVKLNEAQKQTLQEGQPLKLDDMISKKGTEFSAIVQFNADKRYVEFQFDKNSNSSQTQNKPNPLQEIPKVFRGKDLNDDQYNKLKEGQTVYVDGLIDKKGQNYQGYITMNKEFGKIEFSFQNPNKLKEQAKPTQAHKTQVAVNSEGKTNEATKKIKEPLKSAQKNPENAKQKEEQEKQQPTVKSKKQKSSNL